MIITIPQTILKDGGSDWTFDTNQFQVTEENINEQSMRIAAAYSEWSYVAARLRKRMLDLERAYTDWEAKALAITEAEARQTGVVFKSEKAKTTAMYNHKAADGTNDFAEHILFYENEKAELTYYTDLVDNSILKSLSIMRDMIISIGANIRAGMNAQTNAVM